MDFDKLIAFIGELKPWEPRLDFKEWVAEKLGIEPADLDGCSTSIWGGLLDPLTIGQPAELREITGGLSLPAAMEYRMNRWKTDGIYYNAEIRNLRDKLREAVDAGDITLEKDVPGFGKMHFNWDGISIGGWGPGVAMINAVHASWFDPTSGEHVTRAEIEARERVFETAKFLKKYIPGFENAELMDIGWQTISRYGIFIDSMQDFNKKIHNADIGQTAYIVNDEHGSTSDLCYAPLSMLVPKGVENILAAGKCAGNAREVRGMPSCMAMGQAAGTAAALAAKSGTSVQDLDITEIQQHLRKQNAILSLSEAEKI